MTMLRARSHWAFSRRSSCSPW